MRFKRMDSINIVPFIDIMLVLLVIVLTSATFIAQGKIPIALPKVERVDSATKTQKTLDISIDAQGQYYMEEKLVNLNAIAKALEDLPKETPIVLRGDQKSYFEQFIALVGILNQSGHSNVEVEVQQSQSKER